MQSDSQFIKYTAIAGACLGALSSCSGPNDKFDLFGVPTATPAIPDDPPLAGRSGMSTAGTAVDMPRGGTGAGLGGSPGDGGDVSVDPGEPQAGTGMAGSAAATADPDPPDDGGAGTDSDDNDDTGSDQDEPTGAAGADGNEPADPTDDCASEDELCDGLDNDCDGAVDEAVCEAGCQGLAIGDQAYMFCSGPLNFRQAGRACQGQGMRLPRIEAADENDAILELWTQLLEGSLPGRQAAIWLYAMDEEEGSWTWLGQNGFVFWEGDDDGENVNDAYTNWASEQPNDSGGGQDCLRLLLNGSEDGQPGQWTDVACNLTYPFLCEFDQ